MPTDKTAEKLASLLESANAEYRAGNPTLTDAEYDSLLADLFEKQPDHPFLHQVEPEPEGVFAGAKIHHTVPMLSTEKAYTQEDLAAFFRRVEACAMELGKDPSSITYTANAKLDGLSGRLYFRNGKTILSTRGNGSQGNDISQAMDRGLRLITANATTSYLDGEIVVEQAFFEEQLAPLGFKHPRNFMVGFVGADEIQDHHILAAQHGKARFVSYDSLDSFTGTATDFLDRILEINEQLRSSSPYATDGIVISVDDPQIRKAIGSTNHHHRWQIAFKTQSMGEETTVLALHWQTGRTGRVTPVIEVEPVELSGATVRRATAHTAQMVKTLGIGQGSRVRLVRSGEVIPKIVEVLSQSPTSLPYRCPSCGHTLEEDGEYLLCPSLHCTAQAEGRITHFFKTLGNADGFGPKAAEKIVAAGFTEISSVLRLQESDFVAMGFGPGQAANLRTEMDRCLQTPIEDWRFLAAFGIRHLGKGDSRHLLEALGSLDALAGISWESIASVEGFAEKTAKSIASDLAELWPEIEEVRALGFQLQSSSTQERTTGALPLQGLALVFTGTFSIPREELEEQARQLGAQVQSAVNKKTSALVVGEKPGNSKVSKANALGVPTWTEDQYRLHSST